MDPITCMAVAIFFEARSEHLDAQAAVAAVIQNRVEDTRYPNDVCSVVFEDKQFSFTHDNLSDDPHKYNEPKAWTAALEVAQDELSGEGFDITSTHYHTPAVKPSWRTAYIYDGQVGGHLFYTNETKWR